MSRIKLSIVVPPIPTPGSNAPPSPESIRRFLFFSTGETTIGKLWEDIQNEYINKYLQDSEQGTFAIRNLRDQNDNDLDRRFPLEYIFSGEPQPHIINVVQTRIDRECSIPVNSALRPANVAPLPPKRKILPPVPLFHEAENKKKSQLEEVETDYANLDPERPWKSTERDVEDSADGGLISDIERSLGQTLVEDSEAAETGARYQDRQSASGNRSETKGKKGYRTLSMDTSGPANARTFSRAHPTTTPNDNHVFAKPDFPASRTTSTTPVHLRNPYGPGVKVSC